MFGDSQSTVEIANFIQTFGYVPPTTENYDLWMDLHDALQLRVGCDTHYRWVPSHVHPSQADDPFESWVFHWNEVIDDIVSNWNVQHSAGSMKS